MKRDGDLRRIFRQHLKGAQWTSIETGAVAQGVPDSEYCFEGGDQGWIEFKFTDAWAVNLRPAQIGWLMRRARLGGVCFVAVRRIHKDDDELYLVHGDQASRLKQFGLMGCGFTHWVKGPREWDWRQIERVLR